ncbi:hypothetical protein OPV22_024954 [Ensete ventricosum]|uniref:Uncharacterized protein n=1 Tax=Ensete ventricosum TaxID=4639 RepID=A0AAV8P6Y3_ENSVE|nr:hypothetical protein OPV22_024954 [Ensete ventricosum]
MDFLNHFSRDQMGEIEFNILEEADMRTTLTIVDFVDDYSHELLSESIILLLSRFHGEVLHGLNECIIRLELDNGKRFIAATQVIDLWILVNQPYKMMRSSLLGYGTSRGTSEMNKFEIFNGESKKNISRTSYTWEDRSCCSKSALCTHQHKFTCTSFSAEWADSIVAACCNEAHNLAPPPG